MVNLLRSSRGDEPPQPLLTAQTLALLGTRLDDARRWYAGRSLQHRPVAERQRSPELRPALEEEISLPALELILHELAERRASDLETSPAPLADPQPGRLLVCEINMSISSGESEARSQGFFDVDDRPPWDGWLVAFGRTRPSQPDEPIECLICWAPEELAPLATEGIRANPCACIGWLEDRDPALMRQVIESGHC